jgi:DNA repair protein RecO (recombination protein O)
MNWQDEGFLLSKRKFRENANIVDVFTNNYGKKSGIVYGGNSRKIRNYLQISNKIYVFYTAKNENRIGYFKTELIEPISPKYFNDKKRTSSLLSLTSLLNILLPDSQPHKKIYSSLHELINNFYNTEWAMLYVYWELNLIKELGFNPNLNLFKNKIEIERKFCNLDIDNIKYRVPNFLITEELPININNQIIRQALTFTRSLMINKFFIPNNLVFPKSRILMENYFN